MARNEEKQLGQLNRLHLQKLRNDEAEKNPPRPPLATLITASDIAMWLPSIKKDLDFYLKQSQVPCYPNQKINEFSDQITRLRKEYIAFKRKICKLQRDLPCALRAGVERPYPRRLTENKGEKSSIGEISTIELPILIDDFKIEAWDGEKQTSVNCRTASSIGDNDSPLNFCTDHPPVIKSAYNSETDVSDDCNDKNSQFIENQDTSHSVNPCQRTTATTASDSKNPMSIIPGDKLSPVSESDCHLEQPITSDYKSTYDNVLTQASSISSCTMGTETNYKHVENSHIEDSTLLNGTKQSLVSELYSSCSDSDEH